MHCQYLGTEYTGENCLHIAIVTRQYALIEYLFERPGAETLLLQRATGNFFKMHGPSTLPRSE